jgi:hypothetical protein
MLPTSAGDLSGTGANRILDPHKESRLVGDEYDAALMSVRT